jgi:hypothetical protein
LLFQPVINDTETIWVVPRAKLCQWLRRSCGILSAIQLGKGINLVCVVSKPHRVNTERQRPNLAVVGIFGRSAATQIAMNKRFSEEDACVSVLAIYEAFQSERLRIVPRTGRDEAR